VSADKPARRNRFKAKFPMMNFFMTVIGRLAGVVWLTVWLTANALAAPVPAPPNVILITLDTTRADRMGFLGSKLGLTPNLDALARDSAVFTRAYAQAPLTTTSHATILTGTYPQYHLVNTFGSPLAADLPYAPEILRAHGYRTAAFVGSIILNPNEPYAPGFDRGFETYDAGFHNEGPGQDRYRTVQRRGDEVVAHALAWLNQHPKGPFFLWVHLYDAHDPYDPPEAYKTRYPMAPYDGAIAYEDAVVGKLLRQLKLRGLYDGAVMAVTADHGESLGAHGEDTHGIFLYDETIQVPLLIKLPIKPRHVSASGKRIENRVELADILPTLLQAARIEIPKEVQGETLLGLMKAGAAVDNPTVEAWRDRGAYAQSDYPRTEFGWSAEQSLRTGKYLYIQAPRQELYDQVADPKADQNMASLSPGVAAALATQLEAFRQKTGSQRKAPTTALDPAAQEKLGALGYMAGSRDDSERSAPDQGADPKDKIELANMIHRAEVLQQDKHSAESIALLEQVIAKEPGLSLYAKLGNWLMRNEDYQKAVPVLRKAVQLDPFSPGTHFELAKSLMATAEYDAAIPELENIIAKVPNLVEAHSFLELAYARTNHLSAAIRECQTVLQFDPEDYGSYLILGESLARSGDPQTGITMLEKAASLQPQDPLSHAWLAEAYDQLGRKADAARERAEAKRLRGN
jgi:arylsulfatase A-like enzyme/cytochrome c-type biogenesis protein CcmH/NrfG